MRFLAAALIGLKKGLPMTSLTHVARYAVAAALLLLGALLPLFLG